MTKGYYLIGMEKLQATFENLKPSERTVEVWYEFLQKVSESDFNIAVKRICNDLDTIYPGTNMVALIRKHMPEHDGLPVMTDRGLVYPDRE